MALDNYTKRQKFFMTVLVVGLAATFTVSASMIAVFGGGGGVPDAGEFNGTEIRLMKFNNRRSVLHYVRNLDARSRESGHIYGHIPTLSTRGQEDYYQVQNQSLLWVWPQYQDQWVWCHMALAEEATKEGIAPSSPVFIRNQMTAMMNEGAEDIEVFETKDFEREFKRRFNMKFSDALPFLEECFIVGDYVKSLIAEEHTSVSQMSEINTGNKEEIKAEVLRLRTSAFLEQASKEIKREYFAYRSARIAAGFGVSSLPPKYDEFERAFDTHGRDLNNEAEFSFDIIEATIKGFPAPFEQDRARLIYLAVRDKMFEASEEQKKNVDKRLETEEGIVSRDEDKTAWTEEQWTQWRKDTREVMGKYLTYREASPKLNDFLQRENSMLAVQSALSSLLSELDEIKQKRTRELEAETNVLQSRQGIHTALKGYLEGVRRRFDSLATNANKNIRGIQDSDGELKTDPQINAAVNNLLTQLRRLDTSELKGLADEADASAYRYENNLDNAKAELEDFEDEVKKSKEPEGKPLESDNGEPMSDTEIEARKKQLQIKVDEHAEKIKLRDAKSKLVKAFVDELRTELARMQLAVGAAREGDLAMRRSALLGLVNQMPLTFVKLVEDARDRIVPDDEVEAQAEAAELIRADISARNSSKIKDAENTLELDLAAMCGKLNLTLVESRHKDLTWEKIVDSDELSYFQNIEGAKEFLEGALNHAGKVSEILAVPGRGYILLRLTAKTPMYSQGRVDAEKRILSLAIQYRARELAVNALEELRRDIISKGWDSAAGNAATRYGTHFERFDVGFFADKEDLPELFSTNDSDLLTSTSSPAANSPDAPFLSALKSIKASEGVSEVVAEKKLTDPLRRPDREEWSYSLARITDRRITVRRMDPTAMDEEQWGSPAKIWRDRHIASGDVVRRLTQPSMLLDKEKYKIVRYKLPTEEEEDEESEE
ncbi:MAG: hypothetical protein ACYTDT_06855 [Planctomycetota bacterium]